MTTYRYSQRRACRLVGLARSTARYQLQARPADEQLAQQLREQASRHPTYGYRRIAAVLRRTGQRVNVKRIHRLWKREGLQLPRRRARKRRYGETKAMVQKAERRNHVWTYDFLEDRTERGGKLRILAVVDEFTRECLLLYVGRSISSQRVMDLLAWLFQLHGQPDHLRSDNGPEFIAHALQRWLAEERCQTVYITPGSPWENPYIESFNGRLREECLNRYSFATGREAQLILEQWRLEYNLERPHSSLGYLTPTEFAGQVSLSL